MEKQLFVLAKRVHTQKRFHWLIGILIVDKFEKIRNDKIVEENADDNKSDDDNDYYIADDGMASFANNDNKDL